MPIAPAAKGIIIVSSILVAASIALYENEQVREWIENTGRKISVAWDDFLNLDQRQRQRQHQRQAQTYGVDELRDIGTRPQQQAAARRVARTLYEGTGDVGSSGVDTARRVQEVHVDEVPERALRAAAILRESVEAEGLRRRRARASESREPLLGDAGVAREVLFEQGVTDASKGIVNVEKPQPDTTESTVSKDIPYEDFPTVTSVETTPDNPATEGHLKDSPSEDLLTSPGLEDETATSLEPLISLDVDQPLQQHSLTPSSELSELQHNPFETPASQTPFENADVSDPFNHALDNQDDPLFASVYPNHHYASLPSSVNVDAGNIAVAATTQPEAASEGTSRALVSSTFATTTLAPPKSAAPGAPHSNISSGASSPAMIATPRSMSPVTIHTPDHDDDEFDLISESGTETASRVSIEGEGEGSVFGDGEGEDDVRSVVSEGSVMSAWSEVPGEGWA